MGIVRFFNLQKHLIFSKNDEAAVYGGLLRCIKEFKFGRMFPGHQKFQGYYYSSSPSQLLTTPQSFRCA